MRPVSSSSLTAAEVKAEASRLGFVLAGVASAERFAEAEAHLLAWVRAGRHGEMGWIDEARVKRSCDPEQLLPGARSIISVGAPYWTGPDAPLDPLQGKVARYARGSDYHDVIRFRLLDLVAFLQRRAGSAVRARVFVDHGPLVEREAAVRAGLGFSGKNTCLLTKAGSYVLLGAVLTDLALAPDLALPRDCGSCRLCLDACPTGALDEPYRLDARLCISYLTIELRGPIPTELRPKIGSNLFGCDICQEVCPWNHGHGPVPWPEFAPVNQSPVDPISGGGLDLLDLMGMGDEEFRRRFKGSPMKRTRRAGLLRNAAIVLGNSGDQRAVSGLAAARDTDPDPVVRSHAQWALDRLQATADPDERNLTDPDSPG